MIRIKEVIMILMRRVVIFALLLWILFGFSSNGFLLFSLDPPTKEQIEKYRSEGTLKQRIERAKSYGNHLISPSLLERLKRKINCITNNSFARIQSPPPDWRGMPTTGNVKILVLLLSFPDADNINSTNLIQDKMFGKGKASEFPLESLREFYIRSSFDKLKISGNVLGWYKSKALRSTVPDSISGRESLIMEALTFYDDKGHDFSQYDNDNDGDIDYFAVIWSGKRGEWASFWWAYQTQFGNENFKLDGKLLYTYSWQWESYNYPYGEFSPSTVIHESGHALGLPDLYDYKSGIGPDGGVGGMDMMGGAKVDHNCFHKFMLGWTRPEIHSFGSSDYSFLSSVEQGESLMLMSNVSANMVFGEFFMVENRQKIGNDSKLPGNGLAIWHIDSTLNRSGKNFSCDNSYTDHKYIRLMEADGLEQIEKNLSADNGDFYTNGDVFGPLTEPGSNDYNGRNSGVLIKNINIGSGVATFNATVDVPVSINLTGDRKEEKVWLVESDYGDFVFSIKKQGKIKISEFVVQRKYGSYEYEDIMRINYNKLVNNSYSFTSTGLDKDIDYFFRVVVYDNAGNIIGVSGKVKI